MNGFKSNGLQLNSDEFKSIFMDYEQINHEHLESRIQLVNLLSQEEHPLLFKPFYFLHPCKTADWMYATEIETTNDRSGSVKKTSNYTLKWLSFVFFALDIDFDFKFALE